ncbi:MAG: hypothetical protein IAG13_23900 [Deltaproteobacteria bacterium]|nr:hypothetical protein [Nannocystaceae bacterium]
MPRRYPRTLACLGLAAAGLAWGCGDEVVGFFDDSAASDGDIDGSSSGVNASTASSDSAASSDSSGSDSGGTGLLAPGCLSDDFEDGAIDPMLWSPWFEEDGSLLEAAGRLKLEPPSYGIWDTGVVGSYLASFPFVDGRVRVRVPDPPVAGRPVVLFLRVLDDTGTLLSIRLSNQIVTVDAAIDDVEQYLEDFPADPYPAWIAIRAEGALVHYEVSDDGATYTTLATHDKLAGFEVASALIMAQTYGEDPAGGFVSVDDFEVCVQ